MKDADEIIKKLSSIKYCLVYGCMNKRNLDKSLSNFCPIHSKEFDKHIHRSGGLLDGWDQNDFDNFVRTGHG